MPSDFWICFFIWGDSVSRVAGAVISDILLFIWHSADLLLLTKMLHHKNHQCEGFHTSVARWWLHELWGTQPFLVSLVVYMALHRSSAALTLEAAHSHFKLIIKKWLERNYRISAIPWSFCEACCHQEYAKGSFLFAHFSWTLPLLVLLFLLDIWINFPSYFVNLGSGVSFFDNINNFLYSLSPAWNL